MTEKQTEHVPLTISVGDYAVREAEQEISVQQLTDYKIIRSKPEAAYDRIRDRIGKQIMLGSVRAYTLNGGLPEFIDVNAERKHPLIVELAAWLDGKRYSPQPHNRVRIGPDINKHWIAGLHVEDVDIAAELVAAKVRIAELEAQLAALETGGIQVEGKEAPELDAVITLYRTVANSKLPDGLTPKEALLAKAEEMYPKKSPTMREAFATVCNWDSSPGRRKK